MKIVISELAEEANFVRSGLPKGERVITLIGERQLIGIAFQEMDTVYVAGVLKEETNKALRRNLLKAGLPRAIYYVP